MRFFSESPDYSGPIRFEHRGRHSNSLAHSPLLLLQLKLLLPVLLNCLLPRPRPKGGRTDGEEEAAEGRAPPRPTTALGRAGGAEQVCDCVGGRAREGEREIRLGTVAMGTGHCLGGVPSEFVVVRRLKVGTNEVAVESYVESQLVERLRAVLFERRTTQSDRRIVVADVVAAKEENFLWFPETE